MLKFNFLTPTFPTDVHRQIFFTFIYRRNNPVCTNMSDLVINSTFNEFLLQFTSRPVSLLSLKSSPDIFFVSFTFPLVNVLQILGLFYMMIVEKLSQRSLSNFIKTCRCFYIIFYQLGLRETFYKPLRSFQVSQILFYLCGTNLCTKLKVEFIECLHSHSQNI